MNDSADACFGAGDFGATLLSGACGLFAVVITGGAGGYAAVGAAVERFGAITRETLSNRVGLARDGAIDLINNEKMVIFFPRHLRSE